MKQPEIVLTLDTDEKTWAVIAELQARATKAEENAAHLQRVLDESTRSADHLHGLLRRVADVIMGPPPEGGLWGFRDLPEGAARVVEERDRAREALAQAREFLQRVVKYAHEDEAQTPGSTRLARVLVAIEAWEAAFSAARRCLGEVDHG